MSIDWDRLDQPRFDRIVEVLVYRRFQGKVRAVNGRGGDGGIDIEIIDDEGRLWILQLKYFPEGFSGGFTPRRQQIKASLDSAVNNHDPDKWSLVFPGTLAPGEHEFVTGLSPRPKPEIGRTIDRTVLDSWLADDPALDAFLQRDPTTELERLARLYTQERSALVDGASDLFGRVQALGDVIDSTDEDYTADFHRSGDEVSLIVRPQHPGARPTTISVELRPFADENAELREHLDRTIGYGTSDPLRIPQRAIDRYTSKAPGSSKESTRRPTSSCTRHRTHRVSVSLLRSVSSMKTTRRRQALKARSPTLRQGRWVCGPITCYAVRSNQPSSTGQAVYGALRPGTRRRLRCWRANHALPSLPVSTPRLAPSSSERY
jgi:hypothetical protein